MDSIELRQLLNLYTGKVRVMSEETRSNNRSRVEALVEYRTVTNSALHGDVAKRIVNTLSKVNPHDTLLISSNRELSTRWALDLGYGSPKGMRPTLWNGSFYNNSGKRGKSPESTLDKKFDVVVFLDSDNYFDKYALSRTYTNLDRFVDPDVIIFRLN